MALDIRIYATCDAWTPTSVCVHYAGARRKLLSYSDRGREHARVSECRQIQDRTNKTRFEIAYALHSASHHTRRRNLYTPRHPLPASFGCSHVRISSRPLSFTSNTVDKAFRIQRRCLLLIYIYSIHEERAREWMCVFDSKQVCVRVVYKMVRAKGHRCEMSASYFGPEGSRDLTPRNTPSKLQPPYAMEQCVFMFRVSYFSFFGQIVWQC